ncbi:MAG: hypothetical protein R3286_08480 [Gammaproteobacteria bacterium]|nr:hypothetical protein [Gammaproteobacteria bacterium]
MNTATPTEWLPGTLLLALLAVTAIVYWPGLDGPLVLDDHENLSPLMRLGTGAITWHEILADRGLGISGRPLAMLSFVANIATSGGDVWSLKYTNLMIHLGCGTLVFWLAGRLFAEPRAGVTARRWWLALIVAALWLLAPMLVSTVLYVVQRMAQLAALFVIAGLLCYVIGRQRLEVHRRSGLALMALAFVVFWPLATLSKQNGALLPLLAAIVELGFLERPRARRDARLVHGTLIVLITLPCVAAAIVLGIDPGGLGASFQVRDFSIYERLLTEARVLFDYAANLLVLPGGSPLGLFHDDFAVSRGLLDPPTTLLAVLAWGALLGAAWRVRRGSWAPLLAGPVFFLAAHLLESTVVPLEIYFEHRNYLPAVGLYLSLGVVVGRLADVTRFKTTLFLAFALVPVAHAILTHSRVLSWRSHESLLLASAQTHPDSARVHTGLAGLYIERGQLDAAFAHLDRAAALYGERQSYAIALHRLVAYCGSGRAVDPRHYRALLEQHRINDSVYTTNAVSRLADKAQRGACAEVDLERVAEALSAHVSQVRGRGESGRNGALHLYTAQLLAAVGRRREALAHALAAAESEPSWLEPGLLAIEFQLELGDLQGARRTLEELERRDDGTIGLYTRLIESYRRRLEASP